MAKKKEIDHILPKAEGGGEEPWNKRKISQKKIGGKALKCRRYQM